MCGVERAHKRTTCQVPQIMTTLPRITHNRPLKANEALRETSAVNIHRYTWKTFRNLTKPKLKFILESIVRMQNHDITFSELTPKAVEILPLYKEKILASLTHLGMSE